VLPARLRLHADLLGAAYGRGSFDVFSLGRLRWRRWRRNAGRNSATTHRATDRHTVHGAVGHAAARHAAQHDPRHLAGDPRRRKGARSRRVQRGRAAGGSDGHRAPHSQQAGAPDHDAVLLERQRQRERHRDDGRARQRARSVFRLLRCQLHAARARREHRHTARIVDLGGFDHRRHHRVRPQSQRHGLCDVQLHVQCHVDHGADGVRQDRRRRGRRRSGATCIAPSQTAANETCGLALYSTVAGTTYGIAESVAENFTTTNNGFNSTATANVTATTYTGSGLTLVAPGAGSTTWGLTGGTQLDSLAGTGTATYNGSFVTSASYAISDTTASITASGTITGTSLTVTLTQAGSTVATLVIDADGNGSVTYADSTKETVAGYTIFG
jgi:hypothetical protein